MKVSDLIKELEQYYPYEEVSIDYNSQLKRIKGINKYYYDGYYRLVIECSFESEVKFMDMRKDEEVTCCVDVDEYIDREFENR